VEVEPLVVTRLSFCIEAGFVNQGECRLVVDHDDDGSCGACFFWIWGKKATAFKPCRTYHDETEVSKKVAVVLEFVGRLLTPYPHFFVVVMLFCP
jgi:hypothetical protein